jgi:nucleoside-diphosphate-sugar epimerase
MNVYITGIAGFIGSTLAELLVKEGHEVTGCDNLSFGNPDNVPVGVEWDICDVLEIEEIDSDVIVHLAAVSSSRHPNDALVWRNNKDVTEHLAEISTQRIVFASSCFVKYPETGAYAQSKAICEEILAEHTVFRLANVYGPKQRDWGPEPCALAAWKKAEEEGKPILIYGEGTQTRDFIHVDDVARAMLLAVESDAADGEVVDICTGVQTSVLKAADLFEGPREYRERPENEPDSTHQDFTRAKQLLDFEAKVKLFQSRL